MSDDRSGRVRERAYRIWQDEGEPEGRNAEHWSRAERELDGEPADDAAERATTGGDDAVRAAPIDPS